MSRAMRKIQQERMRQELAAREAASASEEESEDEEDDDEDDVAAPARPVNAFALLDDDDDEDEDEDEDCGGDDGVQAEEAEDDVDEDADAAEREPERPAAAAPKPPSEKNAGKGKKGKGKKGKKGKGGGKGGKGGGKEDREFEEALRAARIAEEAAASAAAAVGGEPVPVRRISEALQRTNEMIATQRRDFNVTNELKLLFGSAVKATTGAEPAGGGRGGRGRRQGHGKRVTLRKMFLVQPQDSWPRQNPKLLGLGMESLGYDADGLQQFQFVHRDAYMGIESAFQACVQTGDPQTLEDLLLREPYHVGTLLQMSELLKSMGEMQRASDMVEQALYAFEANMHPQFDPYSGECRLDYTYTENRQFHIALFRHAQYLGRRGCVRTALAVCKLLLGLDPLKDPTGVMLCIDYYALRAAEYDWLLRFVDSRYCPNPMIPMLPHFPFSAALAEFSRHDIDADSPAAAPAIDLLAEAILKFPRVVAPLLEKCNIKVDKSPWVELFRHPLFWRYEYPPACEHILDIYVERTHAMWKPDPVQAFVRKALAVARDTFDSKPDLVERLRAPIAAHFSNPSFQNVYSTCMISDYSDAVSTLPPEMLMGGGGPGDGGPGPGNNGPPGAFAALVGEHPDHPIGAVGGPDFRPLNPNRNALQLFLESLLPWRGIDPNDINPEVRDELLRDLAAADPNIAAALNAVQEQEQGQGAPEAGAGDGAGEDADGAFNPFM